MAAADYAGPLQALPLHLVVRRGCLTDLPIRFTLCISIHVQCPASNSGTTHLFVCFTSCSTACAGTSAGASELHSRPGCRRGNEPRLALGRGVSRQSLARRAAHGARASRCRPGRASAVGSALPALAHRPRPERRAAAAAGAPGGLRARGHAPQGEQPCVHRPALGSQTLVTSGALSFAGAAPGGLREQGCIHQGEQPCWRGPCS